MEQKELNFKPEETIFYFAFVCRGKLEAYEKIKAAILKTDGCELRYQAKSPVKLWITREGVSEKKDELKFY